RAERRGGARPPLPAQPLHPRTRVDGPQRGRLPVAPGPDHALAARTEGGAGDDGAGGPGATELVTQPPMRRLPETRGPVRGHREQELSIGAELDGLNRSGG